jgi:hypothetical protein
MLFMLLLRASWRAGPLPPNAAQQKRPATKHAAASFISVPSWPAKQTKHSSSATEQHAQS